MSGQVALVTGGAGYIGAHVARALLRAGWRVVVLDDLSTGRREIVPGHAIFAFGDVGDHGLLTALFERHRFAAVLHLAGSTSVPQSMAEPLRFYDNNTGRSRVLIEVASQWRPFFVFSSSAAVYGACAGAPVPEDAPCAPLNAYGASKLMTERMLADAGEAHGMAHLSLRYFNVAGMGTDAPPGTRAGSPGSLLATIVDAAFHGSPMPVFGTDHPTEDGTPIRDFIHVADLAAAHLAILPLATRADSPRVLNCGYGHGVSVRAMIVSAERVLGRGLRVHALPRRPGDPSAVVADTRALRGCTRWAPGHDDLDTIVGDALRGAAASGCLAGRSVLAV